ncbi:VOC family protein [Nocardia jejuensis]|uniref:VOC family protein n=1 Tax=Nocardia jejuensis TaxID=328049 RepID=UPI00082CD0EF|nr:VOC family protein [Nocardia jejuensis]
MIGNLRSVVLDCKHPAELARFYRKLLGGTVEDEDAGWSVLTDPQGLRLAFQLAPDHEPPKFPDTRGSQQIHLDITVGDIELAEPDVLRLGATRVKEAVGEDRFRVYRDPAGHTFCLVWGTEANTRGIVPDGPSAQSL